MSELRNILIHIGLPKNATTSIQDTLFLNRDYLLDFHHIDYCPDLCNIGTTKGTGHHAIAWSKFYKGHPHYKHIDDSIILNRLSLSQNVLLSSEWFYQAKNNSLEELVEAWGLPEKRHALLIYRNEFDFIRSLWSQSTKMGHSFLSFKDYYFEKYKNLRKTLSEVVEIWAKNGFEVIALPFEEINTTENDITAQVVEKIYKIKLNKNKWKIKKVNSNVSPSAYQVESYLSIMNFISSTFDIDLSKSSKRPLSQFNEIHDFVCEKVSVDKKKSEFDQHSRLVKEDLNLLPPYIDL
jgi:hypothetical protein